MHQRRVAQDVELCRQCRGREVEPVAQVADGQAVRAGLDQFPERSEAGLVAQRAQGLQCGVGLHDSIIMEIWKCVNSPGDPPAAQVKGGRGHSAGLNSRALSESSDKGNHGTAVDGAVLGVDRRGR